MQTLRREIFNYFRETCPEAPDSLIEPISDLAIHTFEETRSLIERIALTSIDPKLTAVIAMQIIRVWIENELKNEQRAAR